MHRDADTYLRDFSHCLDLVAMAMEAGHDFYQALERVLHYVNPGTCQRDLAACLQEIALGKSRLTCFRELSQKRSIRALQSLTQAIHLSDMLGANLTQNLHHLSRTIRNERLATAEARAQQIPTQLIFPLVFLIFPCIFVVLFAPVLYRILLLDLF